MVFKHNETKNRSWLKLVGLVTVVVIIFLGASAFALNRWYNDNLQPVTTANDINSEQIVVIEPGSNTRTIADLLKRTGLIRNSTAFSWYVAGGEGKGSLQAGTYRISPTDSVEVIVEKISSGDVATNLFTVLPGRRIDQIEEAMIDFGFKPAEISAALVRRYDHPLLSSLPKGASLEGYIYPETYQIGLTDSPEKLLVRAFDEMDKAITADIKTKISKQGLSLHDAVTLASIVYQESGNVEDQPRIAQVFKKRLDEDIQLGSDVTFFYAAAVTGQKPAVDLDSPYNTRRYSGLPPGPISNFSISSLQAVANPADTDFLFFVAGDDGNTYFSKTEAEHQANVDKYCIELCKL